MYMIDEIQKISLDLFPMNEKDYSEEWTKGTRFFHKLQITDKSEGIKQIVDMATCTFDLKMLCLDDACPTSLRDVMCVIANSGWYNNDKKTRINEIHTMIY